MLSENFTEYFIFIQQHCTGFCSKLLTAFSMCITYKSKYTEMVTLVMLSFASFLILSNGQDQNSNCNTKNLPTNFVYEDLNCAPIYDDTTGCLKEYDCSHIQNKPPGKCLLRGKLYQPGEEPASESGVDSRCDHASCSCGEGGDFDCRIPSDSCGEWWSPNWVKPDCYLKYELNRCCSTGQMCPPFEDNIKCEVNGVTYVEGDKFAHPTETCTQCVCHKGFDGKLLAPFCQRRNCTTELSHSKQIRDYCAPFYKTNNCCPSSWICPSENDEYIPAPSEPPKEPQCQFGEKKIRIGETIEQPERFNKRFVNVCDCITPPFLTCRPKQRQ